MIEDVPNIIVNFEDNKKVNKQTEKSAISLLIEFNEGFINPTIQQKKLIVQAFVINDKIVYGKAFDLIKVGVPIDLDNLDDIKNKIKYLKLYELKSTNNVRVQRDFKNYFFGLTTAELLVAQNLKESYVFIFVNLRSKTKIEMTLNQIMIKARGIYPTWSIQF